MDGKQPMIPDAVSQIDFTSISNVDADGLEEYHDNSDSDVELEEKNEESIQEENDLLPRIGMEFTTYEEAYKFYCSYAKRMGFGVRKNSTKKHSKTGVVYFRNYVCFKEGFKSHCRKSQEGKDVKRRAITREGCSAKLDIHLNESGVWVIKTFHNDHNHDLLSPSKLVKHRSHRIFHRTAVCKNLIDTLAQTGMRHSPIAGVVNATSGSHIDNITPNQCEAHLRIERRNNISRECDGVIQHFWNKLKTDEDFYFAMEMDSERKLRSIFWADRRTRMSYLKFGDVIVFDVTYKANKFCMPFAPFTGVNHHFQSSLFGCALLADETEDTFVWLFEEWLKFMWGKAPLAIITSQDVAVKNAIRKVFPDTRHIFCLRHFSEHVIEHVNPYRASHAEFDNDIKRWIYGSKTIPEFELRWEGLKEKYGLEDNSWFAKMYDQRAHWAEVYLKDIFLAGMSSIQRSEGMNAYFDGYLHSNTPLHEFVAQYDNAIVDKRSNELEEDYQTLYSKPVLLSKHPIEAQAGNCYTRKIFQTFQQEFNETTNYGYVKLRKEGSTTTYSVGLHLDDKSNWETVAYDKSGNISATCTCAKFETEGILCRHILCMMVRKSVIKIPDHYILSRWTISARHQIVSVGCETLRNKNIPNEYGVTPLMGWSLRARLDRIYDDSMRSEVFCKETIAECDKWIERSDNVKKSYQVAHVSQVDSSEPQQLFDSIPQISIHDPAVKVTKGRPIIARRIRSGLEISQTEAKKRTCRSCGGKGHYMMTSPKTKVGNLQDSEKVTNLTGGSSAH